jgi:membrane associated rhomboid family serine protease
MAQRGNNIMLTPSFVAITGFLSLLTMFVVGLIFSGRRVQFLLPVGCVFLLGNGMGTLRMALRPPNQPVPILPVREAFGLILPRLLDQWPYKLAFVVCAAALCATYMLMRRALQGERPRRKIAWFLLIVLAVGMYAFFVRYSMGTEAFWVGRAGETNGFFNKASEMTDAKSFLRDYEQDREGFYHAHQVHVWSNMPGKTLLYYAFVRMGLSHERINTLGIVLCALAVVPVFFVVRRLISTDAAAGAAVLFFLFPGLPSSFPSYNAATALFGMLGLWLVLICLDKRNAAVGVVTGLYLALLYFYEPLPFVLTLFLIPYIWRAFRKDAAGAAGVFGGMVSGFILVFIALYLWAGVSILRITRDTLVAGARFNIEEQRDYLPNIMENWGELGTTIGMSVLILMGFALVYGARELFGGGKGALRRLFNETPPRSAVCAFAFPAMLVLFDLSGTNRAEVGRLWIFLMPLMGACAVWAAEKLKLKNYMPILCALLCAEGIFTHVMLLLWPF